MYVVRYVSIALGAMAKPELKLLVTADKGDTECLDWLLKLSFDRRTRIELISF